MKLEDVQKCPECHNEFMQPFTCTTCGAQKLYDATLATAEKRLALAVAALKSARKALCAAHYALLETAPCAAETCKQIQLEAVVSAELACRMEIKVTAETIAQIEEGK